MTFPKSQKSHVLERGFRARTSDPSFCHGDVYRIPALLAADESKRTGQACKATQPSQSRLVREQGQPAFCGPSVWPSVTSQKQTVPSGYAARVPKVTEVQQRQRESGSACWRLFAPVSAPPPTQGLESPSSEAATSSPQVGLVLILRRLMWGV